MLSEEQIDQIAAKFPLTISQLRSCGICRKICKKYGEMLLRITALYSDAVNVQGYHHRGVLNILADCAAQISVE